VTDARTREKKIFSEFYAENASSRLHNPYLALILGC